MPKIRRTPYNHGMSIKQRKFADEYIRTGSEKLAAEKAYNVIGTNATAIGSQNVAKPIIAEYIEKQLRMKDITPEFVIEGIAREAADENSIIRLKALELLGKHLKLFTEKVDHTFVLEKVRSIGWDK